MASVQRNSPIPLYYQVAQAVRNQIFNGAISPSSEIPSERELQDKYQVSRHTIRQAMNLLVSEGLVRRVQGKGSFVLPEGLTVRSRIDTFFEHRTVIREFGFSPVVKHISTQVCSPDAIVRNALNLEASDRVVIFTKLFLADGNPAILAKDIIPEKTIQEGYDPQGAGEDFFDFLEEQLGARVEYLLSDIVPIAAPEEIAGLFNCPVGTPILLLRELFLDSTQNIPLQFAYNYHHYDYIQYSILRNRREP
jgi:GntR family transcriptional regulator